MLFLTFRSGLTLAQNDSLLRGDSTWFLGHVQLMLTKDTFYYLYMEDMLSRVITGDYTIIGDSIHLKCAANCDWKGSIGPIVVEHCSKQPKDATGFYFYSTSDAQEPLYNFTASIIADTSDIPSPCSKLIEIKENDMVISIQQFEKCDATCFTIFIPLDMLYPKLVAFYEKSGRIENNNIRFDDKLLTYFPVQYADEKTLSKKRKNK